MVDGLLYKKKLPSFVVWKQAYHWERVRIGNFLHYDQVRKYKTITCFLQKDRVFLAVSES